MHLVFLNQYYPPDAAPTGVMLQAVAEECARQGHQVTVICAAGGYAGGRRVEGLKVEGQMSGDTCSGVSATVGDCSSTLPNQQSTIHNHQSSISPSSSTNSFSTDLRLSDIKTFDPSSNQLSTSPTPTILRLPATRFGRGTFVGKLMDYASYYIGVAWRLGTMDPPPDRIVALTTPPYLSVLARAVSKLRGADHAHWVMDLYPDVMVAHGMLAHGGWKHRLLAGIARWGFGGRRCAAVLTLGPDMAARCGGVVRTQSPESRVQTEVEIQKSKIINHQSSISSVSWVPLWGAEDNSSGKNQKSEINYHQSSISPIPSSSIQHPSSHLLRVQRGWADDELVVMYSGNMGLGHRFGEVLEVVLGKTSEGLKVEGPKSEDTCSGESVTAANSSLPLQDQKSKIHNHQSSIQPSPSPLSTLNPQLSQKHRFVFYGGGKRRGEIEAFRAAHPEAPVELHDYAPAEELAAHLMTADVHLVSLEPAWTGTMVPSKLQGIFAVGRPVVFVGSRESSIGRWVAESGGGWVVAAGDVDGLRAALEEARDPAVRQARGEAAGRFAKECFDRESNVRRVVEALAG